MIGKSSTGKQHRIERCTNLWSKKRRRTRKKKRKKKKQKDDPMHNKVDVRFEQSSSIFDVNTKMEEKQRKRAREQRT